MWVSIAKAMVGDITVSVGAFVALLVIIVNLRGVRRPQKAIQTIHVRPKVKPASKEYGQPSDQSSD